MKFVIFKEQMLLGLQRAQNVVERRTTMPILSNALIQTEKAGISLAATDLEVGIQSMLEAKTLEEGAITVRARSLLDIVRELPNTDIHFQTKENNRLEITAGKSVFNILGLPAEDFPEIPGFSTLEEQPFIRMNGAAIVSMLDKTLYAVSNDESRYHLNGVYFETIENKDKKHFRMVATDAHRLSLVDHPEAVFDEEAWKTFEQGIIIPKKGLGELRRLLADGKDDFFAAIHGKMLLVKQDNIFLSMRLIEGKYADYGRIVPKKQSGGVSLNKEDFLASLKRVSLVSTDKSKSVSLNLTSGLLELSSRSAELGDAKEELNIDYNGEPLKIGFNSRYLIDALSTIDSEKVWLEIKGKQNPGVIRAQGGSNHTSVVMPMRI